MLRSLWSSEAFSPKAFILRAAIIVVVYGISELLGLREYTSFLSGTSANLNLSWHTAAVLGLIHLLLYVGFILLTPIFLITAAFLTAWKRWLVRPDAPTSDRISPKHLRDWQPLA
jgi:hypothetical protein